MIKIEVLPSFQSDADALARLIYELGLTDPPNQEVVRCLGEALQCAYEAGQSARRAYE